MDSKTIYELLSKNPTCQSGLLLPICSEDDKTGILIETTYSHPCNISEKKIKSIETIHYDPSLTPLSETVKLTFYSPSRERRVVLHEMGTDKSLKRWLVIWTRPGLCQSSVNVTETHGSPYHDESLGGMSWSDDEKFVVFVAEEYAKEPEDFQRFKAKSDWGEKYTKKKRPVIVVVDVEAAQVKVLSHIQLDVAQAIMTRDTSPRKLIFVGYQSSPRTYGLYACTNRPNGLYRVDLDGANMERLSREFDCVQHPRLNPERNEIVFVVTAQGGPHSSIGKLYKMNLESLASECIVDAVERPLNAASFPGLFLHNMLVHPWLDANTLLITSQWQFRRTILLIDVERRTVEDLTPDPLLATWTLVDIFAGYVLAILSSLTCPAKLMLGQVGKDNKVLWRVLRSSAKARDGEGDIFHWLESNVTTELAILPAATMASSEDYHPLEAVIMCPKDKRAFGTRASTPALKMPCIVYPHGGPHVAFCTEWQIMFAGAVALGYAVALVNYTGSTGYGRQSIISLLGRIGDLDVRQTHQVSEYILRCKDWADAQQMFAMGGSHGGFISAWLSAMYPKFYRAVVLRNPVLDLIGNSFASDLPDWSYYEVGLPYHFSTPKFPSVCEMEQMSRASPSSKIAHVTCPTLIILGENDRRVIGSNGLRWHETLCGQGVESRVYIMPGTGHGIEGVVNERESFEVYTSFLAEQLLAKAAK